MAADATKEIQVEIGHVLFIDIVGFSKLSVNEQHRAVEELDQISSRSRHFRFQLRGSPFCPLFYYTCQVFSDHLGPNGKRCFRGFS
jgi:hypothetical protein